MKECRKISQLELFNTLSLSGEVRDVTTGNEVLVEFTRIRVDLKFIRILFSNLWQQPSNNFLRLVIISSEKLRAKLNV